MLEDGLLDATAVLALPSKYRRRLRTTNMLERFIQEIRRREKVIRIFPNVESAYRLVGALCAETHEDGNLGFPRSTGRRYLNMGEYFEWRSDRSVEDTFDEETSIDGELDQFFRLSIVTARPPHGRPGRRLSPLSTSASDC